MSIDRLQSIVLRLANQMMVRYYLHLNHPSPRQKAGIALGEKASDHLHGELIAMGFEYDFGSGIYEVWIDHANDKTNAGSG